MVQLFRTDLQFILDQILLAENGNTPPTPFHPWGLRTVNGMRNNVIPGQESWGSADQIFPRLLTPLFRPAGSVTIDLDGPNGQSVGQQTSYLQTSGYVFDTAPRVISNLIVDQSSNNPAAVEANGGAPTVTSPGRDGIFGTSDDTQVFFIPNVAPDEGLSAPFNSWFTLFGQFFDHGLDLVNKGGSGTVFIELLPDDPLYNPDLDGPDNIAGTADDAANFMLLTRATNLPGPDGVVGDDPSTPFVDESADDIHEHNNQTTPFIDQNQTYTSHPSHQVFLREYVFNASGDAVATGRFLDGAQGGLAQWSDVKEQALTHLGIRLSDHDVHNIPELLTDQFGRFIPGANGYTQVAVRVGVGADGRAGTADDVKVYIEGTAAGLDINNQAAINAALVGSGFTTGTVVRTNHAFLDDIAHHAAPGFFDNDGNPATPRVRQAADTDVDVNGNGVYDEGIDVLTDVNGDGQITTADFFADDRSGATYDNELLDAHFLTGDGRGNENIGLTAVHTIFHAEHNRLVGAIQEEVTAIFNADGASDFVRGWLLPGADLSDGIQDSEWNGERLFQAARVFTEMQYQHLVFEEFARKLQPSIDLFINIDMSINPAIFAEFAHVVYRFGHSMLTETVDRFDANFTAIGAGGVVGADQQQIGLIAAFLNPVEFVASGADAIDATAAVVRGMTRQPGNAIDEFVTDALRSNLVGLPLDLAALNIARGRDTGVPGLNDARRQFFALTGDSQLTPYTSWLNFAENMTHPASVINFIAAYGTHAAIVNASTTAERREAATLLVLGDGDDSDGFTFNGQTYTDRFDFVSGTGIYGADAGLGGLDSVDLWIGGLAERAPAFGGMLGTTFAFVFETQMEMLQNGDRFYYLARFSGLNFLSELEGNSFASLIMRNTDLRHLPGDVFSTPDWTLEVDPAAQFTGLGSNGRADPTWTDEGEPNNPLFPLVVRDNPNTAGPDSNYIRYNGGGHVVLGGTDNADILIAGIGDDTIWGDGGNDRIEGGNGVDILNGGDGDDIITDLAGDDNIKGNDGNDVIHSGAGLDLVIGGRGNDFINIGEDEGEAFAGLGNDFLTSDGTLFGLVGGFGDDWIEAGFGIGGLTGDNADVDGSALNFAGEDVNGGHDVLIGGGAPTDFDSFGGDDIMVAGLGTDRMEGFIGFDWASYQNNTQFGANADFFLRAFAPPAPGSDPGATLDRFDQVEGLSGSQRADILRGDDRVGDPLAGIELTLVGHELNAAGIARISGLAQLLGNAAAGADLVAGTADDMFNAGNIIIGGGGSDIIEGRGGNDVIDGDAYLHVEIGVDRNNDGDVNDANERAPGMDALQAEMLAGTLNPGQLSIVREIRISATTDTDTAAYSDVRANYLVEGQDTIGGIRDVDGDGFIRIVHLARDGAGAIIPGAIGADGIDLIRNIERLQFNDQQVTIFETPNVGPAGQPTISDTTPEEGQTLTADLSGITDPNNISTGGAIAPSTFVVTWQQNGGNGLWTDILVNGGANANEGPVPATGLSYTVGEELSGAQIRVRVTYIDERGVLETVFSAPTDSVTGLNDAPVGELLISDPTPTETLPLTAIVAFTDADGLDGVVFNYQWQTSATGGPSDAEWTDIVGATAETFVPSQTEVGLFVRVVVNYTDGFGFDNTKASSATAIVGDFISLGAGNDTQAGTAGADLILGNGGDDVLSGLAGDDVLDGGDRNDRLNGGEDADMLIGGAGVDTLNGDAGADTLNGGTGNDSIDGGLGDDTIVYNMGDGADTISGGGDVDTLNILAGDASDDLDVTYNGSAITALEGGSVQLVERITADLRLGTDTLSYAATASTVSVSVNLAAGAASGFTSIAGIENVVGGAGADTLVGDAAANSLTGGGGNDVLEGGLGADIALGGLGNDTFLATMPVNGPSDGVDRFDGGGGTDTYSLANLSVGATVDLGAGTTSGGVIGGDTLVAVENAIGSSGADVLIGSTGVNVLSGGGGQDQITGGGGNDILNGDGGNDTFLYTFGDGADTINGGEGVDRVVVTGTAAANSLSVVIAGGLLTSLAGNSLASVETARADLGGGVDTITFGTTAQDVVVDLSTGAATSFESIANIENITGGNGNDTLTGDAGVNVIAGGTGNDVITAGGGSDVGITGGNGNDRFVATVNDGNDRYDGGIGSDTLDLSLTSAGAVVNLSTANDTATSTEIGLDVLVSVENVIGGAGDDIITGDGLVNVLDGGAGADQISAGTGSDFISGGLGDDILTGGGSGDTFLFSANFGADRITDFDAIGNGTLAQQDKIDVSALGITATDFASRVVITTDVSGALITIDGGASILLTGVLAGNITQQDFILGGP
jgi:Ca2+-binding RTX toxin-like protein